MRREPACYVVGCPDGPDPDSGHLGRCLRARMATLRRPEWGDIVAPPDVVELDDGLGSTVCSRALYTNETKGNP